MTQLMHFMSYCLSEQGAVPFEVWFLPLWCVSAVLHLDIINAKSNGILNNILGIVNPLSLCLAPSLSLFLFFLPHLLAHLCNLCLCHLWHQPAHPHLCQTWHTKPNQDAQLGAVQLTRLKQLHLDSDL